MKVSERMTKNPVTIKPTSNAMEAAVKMESENVGTVLVTDNAHLKGIVTDRQIATKVVASGKDPVNVQVNTFMTRDPVTCTPDTEICDATKIIGQNGYRRVPVVKGEKLMGIISVADIAEHAKTCDKCMENMLSEITKAER